MFYPLFGEIYFLFVPLTVSHQLIIMLITVPLQQGRFFLQITYFYIFFGYLKTVALIILNKTMKIIKKTFVSKYMH